MPPSIYRLYNGSLISHPLLLATPHRACFYYLTFLTSFLLTINPLLASRAWHPSMIRAVFVEALDKCFENVCELDLIFHSDKVCCIPVDVVLLLTPVVYMRPVCNYRVK